MATLAAIDRENGPSFILKAVFGFDNFRPGQKEAIDSVLGKKDSIALLPTGAGKSIIYTVLGICLKRISTIIQPLKALMEEQVFSLRQKGVTCYFINGSISAQQRSEIINILTNKDVEYALLFTGPELVTDEQLKDCLKVLHTQDRLTLLSVDESHCIDLWGGGSFHEKYSKLDFLKN